MIILTAAFYAGANRIAQASGLRPAVQYLEMYRHSPVGVRKVG
jgi:hypothetical protein